MSKFMIRSEHKTKNMQRSGATFLFILLFATGLLSIDLPSTFEDVTILGNLQDPASIAFSPDGRLFIGERISGQLRVATYDATSNTWTVEGQAFYSFDVPPTRHRSSGLRGFTFDPNFISNGYIYAFYLTNNPRHNRVVRIQADPGNPNVALPNSETLLISVPFNQSSSSGSHNGGDLVFGNDGKLYFTTGDGWNGGDNVQSLSTYTGKVFRINADGSIPTDNPFADTAAVDYRSIYALGLRNPYTMAINEGSGNIYINDAVGSNKASVYRLTSGAHLGSNFGHDGFDGLGIQQGVWNNVAQSGGKLVTGGAWYPDDGYWPSEYRGNYFCAMWGSNGNTNDGRIVRVQSETNLSVETFATQVGSPPRNKPVMTKIGPDDNLYYLLTDYETGVGEIHMINYTGVEAAAAPAFDPSPGAYENSTLVTLTTTTSNADIFYSLDGTVPDTSSMLYQAQITIDTTTTIKAISMAEGLAPSPLSIGNYTIGPIVNIPPVAKAGPDLLAEINTEVTLNGSDSYDPDGSPLELSESWIQVSGPAVTIADDDETVANFTPTQLGIYVFRITVVDVPGDTASDETTITVVEEIPDVLDNLIARWSMDAGQGLIVDDLSANSNTGIIDGSTWEDMVPDNSAFSMAFDGTDDRIDIGNLDLTGSSMSIAFWFRANDFGTHDARFISKAIGQADADHFWMVSTLNGSTLRFRLKSDGSTTNLVSSAGLLTTNTWTHVAAVYTGTEMQLFVNGNEVASAVKTGIIDSDPLVDAAIGNQPENVSGGSRPFDGNIDEFRIYGRALSPNEILTVMTAGNNSLPITLSQFDVEKSIESVNISWTTQQEIDNAFFTLEKSTNGVDFESIFVVEGAGTSRAPKNYSFIDRQPFTGINYYRLMHQDFSDEFSYSEIKQVSFQKTDRLQVYPNPFTGLITVEMESGKNTKAIPYQVFDSKSILIKQGMLDFDFGQTQIDLVGLPPGNYHLVIASNGQNVRLIK